MACSAQCFYKMYTIYTVDIWCIMVSEICMASSKDSETTFSGIRNAFDSLLARSKSRFSMAVARAM